MRGEFIRDGRDLLGVEIRFIRRAEDARDSAFWRDGAMFVTNYESVRDGKLDLADFTAVSLDEASVLRSFGSKTYLSFLDAVR